MKTILISIMVMAIMGGLVGGGMFAYFSDVETSVDNTFTAGVIDLEIDIGGPDGTKYNGNVPVIFNELNIKPCTGGEQTISLHLTLESNPADVNMTFSDPKVDEDLGLVEPEIKAGDGSASGPGSGELDEFLYLDIWKDEGLQAGWQNSFGVTPLVDPTEGDNIKNGPLELSSSNRIYKGYARYMGTTVLFPNMQPCTWVYIGFAWHFDRWIGQSEGLTDPGPASDCNRAMSDRWGFDIIWTADQIVTPPGP
jgi:predicted ribosomally synthesized peptide with SipW-like signal peptide